MENEALTMLTRGSAHDEFRELARGGEILSGHEKV
jgi:hypothetical protein